MATATSAFGSDASSAQNTTFVQADPSTFRAVVQKLTGAPPEDPSSTPAPKRPAEIGPRKSTFKLHERRHRKLEIKLNSTAAGAAVFGFGELNLSGSPSLAARQRGFAGLVSPVSPLDFMAARGSPRTPISPCEEEEQRAIAEKGFYLHPSPLSTPRAAEPPELLPLFPLHSPRDNNHH